MRSEISIFGKYDVRGKYPTQLNPSVVADIARAFVVFLKKPKLLVVGRDARVSGAELTSSLIAATQDLGVNVVDVGVVPVEVFYFAIRFLKTDGGVFVSASHNKGDWNGLNFAGVGAKGISYETGLRHIEKIFLRFRSRPQLISKTRRGSYRVVNVQLAYFRFLKKTLSSLGILRLSRKLHIAVSGSGGVSDTWFKDFLKFIGSSARVSTVSSEDVSNPNPLLPAARAGLVKLVQKQECDFGVAWDMDGDRCFFIDETGVFIHPTVIASLLATAILHRHPKATVVSDSRYLLSLSHAVRAAGGKLSLSHPGMTVVSRTLQQKKGVFGAEASGHYYFSNTFYRDSGFLPVFYIFSLLKNSGHSLRTLTFPITSTIFVCDEVNIRIPKDADTKKIFSALLHKYRDGKLSSFEGISVRYPDWRFGLRASATEPVIRLTIEGTSSKVVRVQLKKLRHAISLLV